MKGSILLFIVFLLGIALGKYLPDSRYIVFDLSSIILILLMFCVGINLGSSKEFMDIIKRADSQILLVPIITIAGTFAGMIIFSLFPVDFSLKELLAVGSGFGYYSLSSMIIAKISSETLAVVALLSNIFREIISIVFTPLLVKYFGGLSPIVSAGATSMDTALPVIVKYTNSDYVFHAVFNGVVLTLLVPFLVVLFLNI